MTVDLAPKTTTCESQACPFMHDHETGWCGYTPNGYQDVTVLRSAQLVSEFGQLKAGSSGSNPYVTNAQVKHLRLCDVVRELRSRGLLD